MKSRITLSWPIQTIVELWDHEMFDLAIPERALSAADLVDVATAHNAQGLLFSGSLRLDRALMERLPGTLRFTATPSVGFDHVDLEAATRSGILAANALVAIRCTADATMLHILAACRRAREHLDVMRSAWRRSLGSSKLLSRRVTGSTLAILRMGRIGQAVARRARGFHKAVLYHVRRRLAPDLEEGA